MSLFLPCFVVCVLRFAFANEQSPDAVHQGFGMGSLAVTYFHMGNPHYHRRKVVSRSCSGWEGVGPTRYGRQTKRVIRKPLCEVSFDCFTNIAFRKPRIMRLT